jgi:hypothetical protein
VRLPPGFSATKSHSNRQFRSQEISSSISEPEFEDLIPVKADGDNNGSDCIAMFHFLKNNMERGECSIQNAKIGVTVTVLGTQKLLISFVTLALMADGMSGRCVQLYHAIIAQQS